jgi:hypothetical protein
MPLFRRGNTPRETPYPAAERVRAKYASFRELLALNNESLELMAALHDDLQYVPPRRDVLGGRIGAIFDRIGGVVAALERLTGLSQRALAAAVETQQNEIERYASGLEERAAPSLYMPFAGIDADSEDEAGSKAAVLGEIRNRLGLPVPDGFVIATEAYRQYCGIPLWERIRDATHDLDLNDLDGLRRVSESLMRRVLDAPLPAAIKSAISAGAAQLLRQGGALAVRSSARGEGGARSYAGQFLSLLNVPAGQAVDAYRRAIASKFSERALFYRLSAGLREVDTPMAALFLKMIPARAAGIMYTRDPGNPKSKNLWITATRGLGLGLASGRNPADLLRGDALLAARRGRAQPRHERRRDRIARRRRHRHRAPRGRRAERTQLVGCLLAYLGRLGRASRAAFPDAAGYRMGPRPRRRAVDRAVAPIGQCRCRPRQGASPSQDRTQAGRRPDGVSRPDVRTRVSGRRDPEYRRGPRGRGRFHPQAVARGE